MPVSCPSLSSAAIEDLLLYAKKRVWWDVRHLPYHLLTISKCPLSPNITGLLPFGRITALLESIAARWGRERSYQKFRSVSALWRHYQGRTRVPQGLDNRPRELSGRKPLTKAGYTVSGARTISRTHRRVNPIACRRRCALVLRASSTGPPSDLEEEEFTFLSNVDLDYETEVGKGRRLILRGRHSLGRDRCTSVTSLGAPLPGCVQT